MKIKIRKVLLYQLADVAGIQKSEKIVLPKKVCKTGAKNVFGSGRQKRSQSQFDKKCFYNIFDKYLWGLKVGQFDEKVI